MEYIISKACFKPQAVLEELRNSVQRYDELLESVAENDRKSLKCSSSTPMSASCESE